MSVRRVLVIAIALLLASVPSGVIAGGRWDARDARGPLDIRWVGVYRVSGNLHKVTLVFWRRVSDARLSTHLRISFVDDDPYGAGRDSWRLQGRQGNLRLRGRESRCRFTEGGPRMVRISPTTIRFYVVGWGGVGPIRYLARTTHKPCGNDSTIDAAGPALLTT